MVGRTGSVRADIPVTEHDLPSRVRSLWPATYNGRSAAAIPCMSIVNLSAYKFIADIVPKEPRSGSVPHGRAQVRLGRGTGTMRMPAIRPAPVSLCHE